MTMLSTSNYNAVSENSGALRGKPATLKDSMVKGKINAASGGLTLRNVNTTQHGELKSSGGQHTIKKRVLTKSQIEDPIEHMPDEDVENDTYEDILPFEHRPTAAILRRIFCIPHGSTDSDEDNLEEVIQWPSLSRLCPFSDDADQTIAEEISDDYEPCLLSDYDLVDEEVAEKNSAHTHKISL